MTNGREKWTIGGGRAISFSWPALFAFSITCFTPSLLRDGDTWWHLKAGEWIIKHHSVPFSDPFSFTFYGQPWHAHEWLAELLMAFAFSIANWNGVVLLCATAVGLTFGLLHQWICRFVGPTAATVSTLLAASCLTPSLLARPHLLVWPLLVIWMRVLLRARELDKAPCFAWLLLIVVWANMHGSAMLAVGLVGIFAIEALIAARSNWRRVLREWTYFGFGSAIALLATPRGLEGLIFLIELTQMKSLASIVEWQPTNFTKLMGFELLLGTGIYVISTRGIKVPPMRAALLLFLIHMSLIQRRHQMFFGVIGVMLVCEAIGRAEGDLERPVASSHFWLIASRFAAIAVVALRLSVPVAFPQGQKDRDKAFASVPAEYHLRPVLNEYALGGYLIGKGVRPFIDGRTDLYGDAFNARYDAIMRDTPSALDKVLEQYDIAWSMMPMNSAPAKALDQKTNWKRAYAGNGLIVHLRVNCESKCREFPLTERP